MAVTYEDLTNANQRYAQAGGCSPRTFDDLGATPRLVQTGPTLVSFYDTHNVDNAQAFVLMFDAASTDNVTVGSTTPDYYLSVNAAGTGSATSSARGSFPKPMYFKNGLVIAATTTTDGSTTADVDLSICII